MTFRERINELISWLKISRAEFERRAGLSNGYTRNLGGVPGAEKLEDPSPEVDITSRLLALVESQQKTISEQAATISRQAATIEKLAEGSKKVSVEAPGILAPAGVD